MFFFLIYAVAQRFLRTITGRSSVAALEIENAVLRHQLAVFRRRVGRPRFRRMDRVLTAAASRMLPRDRWSALLRNAPDPASMASRAGEKEMDVSGRKAVGPPPLLELPE